MPKALSTKNLKSWPDSKTLRSVCQSLAILSLIQNDEERFSYHSKIEFVDVDLFRFSNGQGDSMEIIFSKAGVFVRGFGHESITAAWSPQKKYPGVIENFPLPFKRFYNSFLKGEEISFCAWNQKSKNFWEKSEVNLIEARQRIEGTGEKDIKDIDDYDGSEYVMSYLYLNAKEYIKHESKYYEVKMNPKLVSQIFSHTPLTDKMIMDLNPDCEFSIKSKEIRDTKYPTKS